ncbi:uncharacterized protein LOC124150160 isoform X2 [Haliotis rufescens]|uniref:uncharacterized protein LOC124150160 isoform X2 n=1 Tax=Haliotis rufescens TaxID=6454 RepID=UPI00201F5B20|nr:uncharacterized protein LOC124150160 isoform X2 [Haliotis rufescens]
MRLASWLHVIGLLFLCDLTHGGRVHTLRLTHKGARDMSMSIMDPRLQCGRSCVTLSHCQGILYDGHVCRQILKHKDVREDKDSEYWTVVNKEEKEFKGDRVQIPSFTRTMRIRRVHLPNIKIDRGRK